jgi:pheromone shutdown protein TraB
VLYHRFGSTYNRAMATASTRQVGRGKGRRGPGSRRLLGAAMLTLFGAFLPWVATAAGNVAGVRGAGLWTMYAAVLGVAGAIIRSHTLAAVHAALLAVVAVVLPVWQVLHLAGLVGFTGWAPGPGLVMTLGGGVLAGSAAVSLFRASRTTPSPN